MSACMLGLGHSKRNSYSCRAAKIIDCDCHWFWIFYCRNWHVNIIWLIDWLIDTRSLNPLSPPIFPHTQLTLRPLDQHIWRAWSREEGVAQHIHIHPFSDNDGSRATYPPRDAHWASMGTVPVFCMLLKHIFGWISSHCSNTKDLPCCAIASVFFA